MVSVRILFTYCLLITAVKRVKSEWFVIAFSFHKMNQALLPKMKGIDGVCCLSLKITFTTHLLWNLNIWHILKDIKSQWQDKSNICWMRIFLYSNISVKLIKQYDYNCSKYSIVAILHAIDMCIIYITQALVSLSQAWLWWARSFNLFTRFGTTIQAHSCSTLEVSLAACKSFQSTAPESILSYICTTLSCSFLLIAFPSQKREIPRKRQKEIWMSDF